MADTQAPRQAIADARPLSPHLSVYRRTLTMMMSIAHRVTGIALYAGTLLLAWWLMAASGDAATFATVSNALHSWVGQIVLFGFTWALFHHLLGGVRHFLWDSGWGLEHPEREYFAQATLVGGLVLALGAWMLTYARQ